MSARKPKGGRTVAQPWEPFTERVVSSEMAEQLTAEGWEPGTYAIWRNNRYQVLGRGVQLPPGTLGIADGRIVHLSIKRVDRGPIVRDWRHMQRIKNELVGPECEGVELYPAESRLLDEANQYHMWVVPDATFRFPFGRLTRLVEGPEATEGTRARQRGFDAKVVRSSDIDRCPLRSLAPSHYRLDGTCMCNVRTTYTRAEIVDGTGWPASARFAVVT